MDARFQDAVNETSYNVAARNEVVEHYKDTYGAANWRKHIVDAIMKTNPGAKRASVQREFQYDKRLGRERYTSERVSKTTAEKYQKVGESIGRIPKKDTIEITVKGTQSGGVGRPPRDRTIKATLSGDKARAWVNNPNFQDIWDAWSNGAVDFGNGDGDDDESPSLLVSSVSAA